jgi:2-phosphosulfolactate phosphatase
MTLLLTPREATRASGCAVVIDVMRAFTTAAWAFHLGAERIVLLRHLEEALELKSRTPGSLAFQDGALQAGFDLANSPVQIQHLDLVGRTVFQRTSAGTQGALAASGCEPLICTGFATADATAAHLRLTQPDHLAFVITGEDGRAAEDVACAEYIAASIAAPAVSAAPYREAARNSRAAKSLHEAAEKGYAGVHRDDVERCLEVGRFDFVMHARREAGLLTLRPSAA